MRKCSMEVCEGVKCEKAKEILSSHISDRTIAEPIVGIPGIGLNLSHNIEEACCVTACKLWQTSECEKNVLNITGFVIGAYFNMHALH